VARVLIGTDGSLLADQAAARALKLLGAASDVTIARVVPRRAPAAIPAVGIAPATTLEDEMLESSHQAALQEAETDAAALARHLGVTATTKVVEGDPGHELCRLARDGDYDVVVVGSHGSGFLKRVLLGSVSHHVLHHAPCPVLIVRAADDGEDAAGEGTAST
jgi:nucleotide-binding universal stress UspA family protein